MNSNTPPLSLPLNLERGIDFLMFLTGKGLGADVCFLTVGRDVIDMYKTGVVNFTEPMIYDIDVLGSLLKNWVGCQCNCTLVFHKDFKLLRYSDFET